MVRSVFPVTHVRSQRAAHLSIGSVGLLLFLVSCSHASTHTTLDIRHVRHPNFKETHRVALHQRTGISDATYTFEVIDFVADFSLNRETMKVTSRSNEMTNPAFKIRLYKHDDVLYEAWVLKANPMQHRVRAPGFVFRYVEVERE